MANVMRCELFKNDELKTLMMIPDADKNNMLTFRDKYVTRESISSELITNQVCRILYYEDEPADTYSQHVLYHRIYFDIYVRREYVYNAGQDRMLHRGHMIAGKLTQILRRGKTHNITFFPRGVYDQTSKQEGYEKVTASFLYKRIYN